VRQQGLDGRRGTPSETLTGEYLPLLLRTAADIGHDWAMLESVPSKVITPAARTCERRSRCPRRPPAPRSGGHGYSLTAFTWGATGRNPALTGRIGK
jgi:hypothetical protein